MSYRRPTGRVLHQRFARGSARSWTRTSPQLGLDANNFRYLKRVFVVDEDGAPSPQSSIGGSAVSYGVRARRGPDELAPEPTHRDDPSYWLYTSGTEKGIRKGIVHLQRDMVYCTGTWLENVSRPTPNT